MTDKFEQEKYLLRKDGVRWLRTIYTSELSFFFHLPIFLELSSDKYKNANPLFQITVFVLRFICNTIALIYLLYDSRTQELWVKHPDGLIVNMVSSEYSSIGWYALLASTILYYISYQHQKLHISKLMFEQCQKYAIIDESNIPDTFEFPANLFFLSMFSFINFVFDLPASGVPATIFSRFIVCGINIVCVSILLFVIFFEEPFIKAWGCYPSYNGISDYNFGMCPAFYGRTSASCCDQPGVRCGKEVQKEYTIFNVISVFIQSALSVSFGVYIISVTPIVSYYTEESKRIKCIITDVIKKRNQ